MKDLIKYQQRVLRGIIDKLGEDVNIEEEYNNIVQNKSILSFRERQYIVLLFARQTYLKNNPDDSVEGQVD